ncbi:MAG: hypothetical protein PHO10_06750 [Gemmiger sp.]|nr:hypothetical protein [Gemmiger sp.]
MKKRSACLFRLLAMAAAFLGLALAACSANVEVPPAATPAPTLNAPPAPATELPAPQAAPSFTLATPSTFLGAANEIRLDAYPADVKQASGNINKMKYPSCLLFHDDTIYAERIAYDDALDTAFTLIKIDAVNKQERDIAPLHFNFRYQNGILLQGRYLLQAPCMAGSDGLEVEWQKTDCETGETEILYKAPVKTLFATMQKASEDTAFLLVDGMDNGELIQKIISYRLSTGECHEIYASQPNSVQDDFANPKPWIMAAADGKLYVLELQQIQGKYQTSMLVLDDNGLVLDSYPVPALDGYGLWESNPVDFVIFENHFFIRYYDSRALMPVVFLSRDTLQVYDMEPMVNLPLSVLTPHVYNGNLTLFSTYVDNQDYEKNQTTSQVVFINLDSKRCYPVQLNQVFPAFHLVEANSRGDILVSYGEQADAKWRIFSVADIERFLAEKGFV